MVVLTYMISLSYGMSQNLLGSILHFSDAFREQRADSTLSYLLWSGLVWHIGIAQQLTDGISLSRAVD